MSGQSLIIPPDVQERTDFDIHMPSLLELRTLIMKGLSRKWSMFVETRIFQWLKLHSPIERKKSSRNCAMKAVAHGSINVGGSRQYLLHCLRESDRPFEGLSLAVPTSLSLPPLHAHTMAVDQSLLPLSIAVGSVKAFERSVGAPLDQRVITTEDLRSAALSRCDSTRRRSEHSYLQPSSNIHLRSSADSILQDICVASRVKIQYAKPQLFVICPARSPAEPATLLHDSSLVDPTSAPGSLDSGHESPVTAS
ncbi:hypothetical protein EIP91_005910 [Steccherinum ochraceum]|uniref:Uncharacterized protein n=1 Tax=Steccherinum ochraceum TaxID=92696 RepID=A0A4R0R6I8_9APHY|nr:hypothetical protein EIP91_005910 [Steccherinum ochraceum]